MQAARQAARQTGPEALPIPMGWYAVAASEDLTAGQVQPLHYFDQELVLFRTESGKPHLMEAYCPHLGAHLGHGGTVLGERIACPFHGWQMDGAGAIAEVPYAKKMPPRAGKGACLHSFPMQERNRMVWAWFHPQKAAPTFDIEDVPELADPDWSAPATYEWEINSCLQETGENAVDIAHFVYVHGATDMPSAKVTLEGAQRTTDMTSVGPCFNEDGSMDPEKTEDMHLVTKNFGPGMALQLFARAFKTVMMATMVPITPSRLKLRFMFTKPLAISEQHNFLTDALIEEIVRQVGHDIPIWEHKIFRDDPILCDGDGPIAKYRSWFQQFYATGGQPGKAKAPRPANRPSQARKLRQLQEA